MGLVSVPAAVIFETSKTLPCGNDLIFSINGLTARLRVFVGIEVVRPIAVACF
jgi:hypothetical protein